MDIITATSDNNLFLLKHLTRLFLTNFAIRRKDWAEVGIVDDSDADFVEVQKDVAHHPFAEDRIVGVLWVLVYVSSHPLREGESVPSRSIEEELFNPCDHFDCRLALQRTRLNSVFDFMEYSSKCPLSEENFGDC